MKKFIWTVLLLGIAINARAQTATASWFETGVTSAAQSQSLQYKTTTTPAGSTTADAPVIVTNVTCTGTTAPFSCSGTIPAPEGGVAKVTGAKTTITAQDIVNGTPETLPSLPFIMGATVPTGLKITELFSGLTMVRS